MLKNYFLVALRNVMRNRVYTFLNVFGLALGIACGLIAFWFIRFQTSYDSFHENKDRIFQVTTLFIADKPYPNRGVPPPMSEAVRKEMPNLKASMCVERSGRLLAVLDANGKVSKKFQSDSTSGAFIEPHYFEIFTFPWLVGKYSSMGKPDKIALSEKLAKKYFGKENPIGKVIRLDNEINLEVVGIFANIAENTELRHEFYISFETLKSHKEYEYGGPPIKSWGGVNSNTYCYALFPQHVSLATMKPQMDALTKKYHPKEYKTFQHYFVPFRDIHFIEDYQNNVIPVRWLWIMASIGAFLILTACFNFINMATAQAMRRAKEVGVRKAIGGSNSQIFYQFMTETGIIVFFALVIGIGLGALVLPNMNVWLKINLWASSVQWADGIMWLLLVCLFVVVTALAGTYPALVLAGFKPIIALKGSVSTRQIGGVSLRRILIVFQFVWIQLLLICMLIINQQMTFMQTADVGYNKSGVVTINIPQPQKLQQETFRQRMMQIKGIENLSFCLFTPTANSMNTTNIRYHTRPKDEIWSISTKPYDIHFLDTYGLKLVAGTNIPKSDTLNGYLVLWRCEKLAHWFFAKSYRPCSHILLQRLLLSSRYSLQYLELRQYYARDRNALVVLLP
ncbi:MAG: ABC transporter permease [Bacteroidetes bacterium]|nr:MAG: ABC transporter permease [Bacteroidota bacterium]